MSTPNAFQKTLGPRWHVTKIDPGTAVITDIAVGDGLSFEGDGLGNADCKLMNVTQNIQWGKECKHPHPISGKSDEVEVKTCNGNVKWTITRSKPSGDRYQIVATPSASGSGSWTATEG